MRLFGRLLGGLVLLVLVFVGIGMLLPREVIVTRSTTIDAPPEAVFPHVNSLEKAAAWSPWLGIDPDIRTTYTGPSEGVGNRLEWTSEHPDVGSGSQEIIASAAPSSVRTALDFGAMGGGEAWFTIAPDGAGSSIEWGLKADMGAGPIGRWFGPMMDRWAGADHERGLADLKSLVESG